jgi:hypothetical protein
MTDQSINVGDQVLLTAACAVAATGLAVDPTTVVITVKDPSGTVSTPAVTHPSTGVYQAAISITLPGMWQWKATGTGAAQAQNWTSFSVPVPPF